MCKQTFFIFESRKRLKVGGGGGGIRTPGALSGTLVFKTRAFNHSATPPAVVMLAVWAV